MTPTLDTGQMSLQWPPSAQVRAFHVFPATLREQSLLVCSAALEDALAPVGGLALKGDDIMAHWLEFPRETFIFTCLHPMSRCVERNVVAGLQVTGRESQCCDFQN